MHYPRGNHSKTGDAAHVDLREVVDLFRNHIGKLIVSVLCSVGLVLLYLNYVRPV